MKNFVNPEVEVQKIAIEDVITTSETPGGAGGENELPR